MGNDGKGFELLTQGVFQAICDQDTPARTVEVKQNVVLQGRSTTHQVDVYWEFELGGVLHKTVISCKDWKNPVKKEQVLSLKSTLDDLPGSPTGVVVTKTGFQAGARKYATSHGIALYELREPNDEDWEGRIRSINIEMQVLVPSVRDFQVVPDDAWIEEERKRRGLPDGEGISMSFRGPAGAIVFTNEDGEPLMTAGDAIQAMLPTGHVSLEERSETFQFNEPTYLPTGDPRLPRVRLKSVSAKVSISSTQHDIVIDAGDVVAFILRDAAKGEVRHMFDKDLGILGAETDDRE